jgi:hypothetical protein
MIDLVALGSPTNTSRVGGCLETAMPEVWEQEGHLRSGPFLRGDIQEELKF